MSLFTGKDEYGYTTARIGRIVVCSISCLFILILFFNSFAIIQAGHTGVVTNLGAVSNVVLQEGFHFKAPFVTNVINIDNRVQRADVDVASASKDLQSIASTVSINYRIDKSQSANVYKNIGYDITDIIVRPAVQECVKAVTAKFTAEEIIVNRQLVGEQMKETLEDKIGSYGVIVEVFNIVNFSFSEEFDRAIEAKQTAQQNALRAEQELVKVRIDAQQKVEQAKADALATREVADAEAYAIKVVQEQLQKDPAYIEYKKIEKWNGELPKVQGESSPIIDLRDNTAIN